MRFLQILTLSLRIALLEADKAWIRIQLAYHRARVRYWKARAEAAQTRLRGGHR